MTNPVILRHEANVLAASTAVHAAKVNFDEAQTQLALVKFVFRCGGKSSDWIYTEIERMMDLGLYDTILSHAAADTPEPVRSALHALGRLYDVQALKDY